MSRRVPLLSKSLLMASRQCERRMYLECHHPEHARFPAPGVAQHVRDRQKVASLARRRFAGGVEIPNAIDHDEAVRRTAKALDAGASIVYDAAFTAGTIGFRADIVARVREPRAPGSPDRFDLVEITTAMSIGHLHEFNLAIQMHVLEGAGVPVRTAYLMHLNREYVYPGGLYRIKRLLRLADRTPQARELDASVSGAISPLSALLAREEEPAIEIGKQCRAPWPCPFHHYCSAGKEHDISELPAASPRLLDELRSRGINSIVDIPEDEPQLTPLQRRVRGSIAAGVPYVSATLAGTLDRLVRPLHFVDFETSSPAVPIFPGTHPYEVVPFQWSDHTLNPAAPGTTAADGVHAGLEHAEYLDQAAGQDPRRAFAQALIERLAGDQGSVVVWSGHEQRCLSELARALPDLAPQIDAICDRIVDLLPVVREHCYHPQFHGSFSLKKVMPALAPHLGYDDLEIRDGLQATLAFSDLMDDHCDDSERDAIRAALLAYCGRDTLALFEVYAALSELARTGVS